MVPYVHVPSTEITISTMTSENRQLKIAQKSNLITRLSLSQVQDITSAVTTKYDIVI
jgi:hypothetical protein